MVLVFSLGFFFFFFTVDYGLPVVVVVCSGDGDCGS